MQQTSTNNNKHQRTSTNINKPSTNINWHAPRMEFVSPKVGQMLVDNWYNGAKGCSWSSDQDIFAIRMLQVRETSQFPRCAFGVVRKYDYDAILYKNISIHRYLCNMIAQICIYIYTHCPRTPHSHSIGDTTTLPGLLLPTCLTPSDGRSWAQKGGTKVLSTRLKTNIFAV